MPHLRDRVLNTLDDKRSETVELLRELIVTASPSGDERAIARVIANRLRSSGFDMVDVDELHNVVCRIDGVGGAPTLMYNGHIDVVPIGDLSLWPIDPTSAPFVGDRVFGRGASDMKGSVAAMMMAARAVISAGAKLRGNLVLTFVSREERGNQEGTKHSLDQISRTPDLAIIGEPTNLDLALGSRGRIIVDVSVKGKLAHAAHPSEGINAVTKMSKVIDAVARMPLPSHEFMGPTTQAITNITCEPGRLNMIPSRCTISVSRRVVLGDGPEKTKSEFEALIDGLKDGDPELEADVQVGKFAPPAYTPPDESVIGLLQGSARFVLGRTPKARCYVFGTDGSYISGVTNIPWVGFGPGDEACSHSSYEHVKIDDLVAASKVYAMFIMDYLS